jgi:hypothetical protein
MINVSFFEQFIYTALQLLLDDQTTESFTITAAIILSYKSKQDPFSALGLTKSDESYTWLPTHNPTLASGVPYDSPQTLFTFHTLHRMNIPNNHFHLPISAHDLPPFLA